MDDREGGPSAGHRLTLSLALGDRHEGETVMRLLRQHNKTVQDLARAAEVEWPAAKKYVTAQRIGAKAWETCSRGLVRLEIDSSLVRPTIVESLSTVTPEDLKPLLTGFDDAQLDTLLRILRADHRSRERLVDAIEGILLWRKK